MTNHQILIGDSRKLMKRLPSSSVQLIITSPPYFDKKDYSHPDQIGLGQTYQDYLSELAKVWKESFRVLEAGCNLIIDVGEVRSRENQKFKIRMLPCHLIDSLEKIGFSFKGATIWFKKTKGKSPVWGSYPFPRTGVSRLETEWILRFLKPGDSKDIRREIKEHSRLSLKEWLVYFSPIWEISGVQQKEHPAMFPLEIPYRLIRMFSFKAVPELDFSGDTVLDPFLGSGTTTKAAILLDRNSIGIELNPEYLEVIKEKIGFSQKRLDKNINIKIWRE
ncbi:MAG TPA: site-specific DNA-methyltransferase [Archaeoglobaceae archaeon]|nr:site-specific DNA-methyltransferase [Archaeoglobaceae archaeon]